MSKIHKRHKQGFIFRKLLGTLVFSCILTAVLSVFFICLTSADVYANRIADEMIQRARAVSRIVSRYQTGQLSYDSFIDIAIREQHGADVYIIDQSGVLQISTDTSGAQANMLDESLTQQAMEVLLSGETRVWIDWRASHTLVVGTPVADNMMRVTGVVLMTKQAKDVFASLRGLILTILLSCIIASLVTIVPAYFASKRMAKPIQQMTAVSILMASGDFSARADESADGEVGQLGSALNHLSQRLEKNINDLTLTRNQLRETLEGLHEGVISLDAEGEIIFCNRAALAIFDCLSAASLKSCLPNLEEASHNAVETRESQKILMSFGEKRLLLVVSRSQVTSDRAPGTVVVVQDVTESERLEQTRRDYVANVSHELRTPIASIRSLAETLNDDLVKNDEDRTRYYGYILRESLRLSRLINDLLELSRLQSGTVALEAKPFDLAELMRDVSDQYSVTAGYSGISVSLDEPEDARLLAISNRDRIEQVLVALMDNAIKFASDEGQVTLRYIEEKNRYWVLVRNTGNIAETDLPHIFDRFYKSDTAHADHAGTGLGLAIVKEIMDHLGETILAENDGDSALFRFTVAKAGETA